MGFTSLLAAIILVVGLILPSQADAILCEELPTNWCVLDGECFPPGTRTSAERCLQYTCVDGAWMNIDGTNPSCGECSTSEDTFIKMYEEHATSGSSYKFNGPVDTYHFSQYGLEENSSVGIDITFVRGNILAPNETRITNVRYKEFNLTIEFEWLGPLIAARIMVDGNEVSIPHDGSMTPFSSSIGDVYVSNDSPSWPYPYRGGNIVFVGSQGLTVTIYALNGYAWFVNSYAVPSLRPFENDLYGLCDVLTPGVTPLTYTMQNGDGTINLEAFIDSWKISGETSTEDNDDISPLPLCGEDPQCSGADVGCVPELSGQCVKCLACRCLQKNLSCCKIPKL